MRKHQISGKKFDASITCSCNLISIIFSNNFIFRGVLYWWFTVVCCFSVRWWARRGLLCVTVVCKRAGGEHGMAVKTEALNPRHRYVPWITLNGVCMQSSWTRMQVQFLAYYNTSAGFWNYKIVSVAFLTMKMCKSGNIFYWKLFIMF